MKDSLVDRRNDFHADVYGPHCHLAAPNRGDEGRVILFVSEKRRWIPSES